MNGAEWSRAGHKVFDAARGRQTDDGDDGLQDGR